MAQMLSEENKELLKRNLPDLVDRMRSTANIVDGLVAQGIFDHREIDELRHDNPGEYNRRVVYRLLTKSDKGFFVFVAELRRTSQLELANRLYRGNPIRQESGTEPIQRTEYAIPDVSQHDNVLCPDPPGRRRFGSETVLKHSESGSVLANPESHTTAALNDFRSAADKVEKCAARDWLTEYQSREVISTAKNLKDAVGRHRSKYMSELNQASSDLMSRGSLLRGNTVAHRRSIVSPPVTLLDDAESFMDCDIQQIQNTQQRTSHQQITMKQRPGRRRSDKTSRSENDQQLRGNDRSSWRFASKTRHDEYEEDDWIDWAGYSDDGLQYWNEDEQYCDW